MKGSDFLAEFPSPKDELSSLPDEVIIAGYYKIHWDKSGEIETEHFMVLLHSTNVVQHVDERTHISSHVIDLVITRDGQNVLDNLRIVNVD